MISGHEILYLQIKSIKVINVYHWKSSPHFLYWLDYRSSSIGRYSVNSIKDLLIVCMSLIHLSLICYPRSCFFCVILNYILDEYVFQLKKYCLEEEPFFTGFVWGFFVLFFYIWSHGKHKFLSWSSPVPCGHVQQILFVTVFKAPQQTL